MVEAPLEFGSDKSMFSKLVRAQHYGLPTRLLDVTINPLVALYFACCDTGSADGVVHIFDFNEERVKFADSDAVSVICNLAKLSHSELQRIRAAYRANGPWTKSKVTAFRQLAPIERLIQFVRVEKPYFLNVIKPVDVAKYFFVYPEKTNRRVIAQSGAFVAAGIGGTEVAMTGRAGVGKSLLADAMEGRAAKLDYKLRGESHEVETSAVALGARTRLVRVLPGQEERPDQRWQGLPEDEHLRGHLISTGRRNTAAGLDLLASRPPKEHAMPRVGCTGTKRQRGWDVIVVSP